MTGVREKEDACTVPEYHSTYYLIKRKIYLTMKKFSNQQLSLVITLSTTNGTNWLYRPLDLMQCEGNGLFILFMGFSRQEYWSGLPFPSPVDHILSECSTMTCPSWVALNSMVLSFIELDKALGHVISLVSFLCLVVCDSVTVLWTVGKGKNIWHWKMNTPGR